MRFAVSFRMTDTTFTVHNVDCCYLGRSKAGYVWIDAETPEEACRQNDSQLPRELWHGLKSTYLCRHCFVDAEPDSRVF